MMRGNWTSLTTLISVLMAFPGQAGAAAAKWVDGYYVGYERALYPVSKIDFSALTHIMVGRYAPKADGSLDKSCDWDASRCPAWAKSVGVRAHAKGRKALLFLGGAGAHDGFAAATKIATRQTFVSNIVKAVDGLGLDGVDVDWEPVESADKAKVIWLIKALRKARPNWIITMPIGWVNANEGAAGYDWLPTVAPYLDQINIMTYDMDGSDWGWTRTWFSSALKGETQETPSSVISSGKAFSSLGIRKAKIGIGMGFYGQCWTGGVTGPRQAQGNSKIVASDGEMSYANIMDGYYTVAKYHYDAAAGASWLGSASGLGKLKCTYISYEDKTSVRAKMQYLKTSGYGGAIIWTISQGYRPSTGKNDLLTTVRDALK